MEARTKIGLGVGAALLALIAWWAWRADDRDASKAAAPASATATIRLPPRAETSAPAAVTDASAAAAREESADASARAGLLLGARWGSRRGELGRDRPAEGNPEGPMSFAITSSGALVVDQVNGRVVRYDASGKLVGSSEIPVTVQDVAVGPDGTVALMDRLAGKSVSLTDANGRRVGELPLRGVGETGTLTGIFVDGKDVYVEQGHGALVLIGTTDGRAADEAKKLVGRPSKDGVLLLTANLASPAEGRVVVNAFDRKKDALRFARQLVVPRPAQTIVLLDTDAKGVIYVGVGAGDPEQAVVTCLDPGDGHVLGRVALALSATPEESFRDFVVGGDGTIAYAVRSEEGLEYRTARCP